MLYGEMTPGIRALRHVNRWSGPYRLAPAGGGEARRCGRAEAQRTVRAAIRYGLEVEARVSGDAMVVTVVPPEPPEDE